MEFLRWPDDIRLHFLGVNQINDFTLPRFKKWLLNIIQKIKKINDKYQFYDIMNGIIFRLQNNERLNSEFYEYLINFEEQLGEISQLYSLDDIYSLQDLTDVLTDVYLIFKFKVDYTSDMRTDLESTFQKYVKKIGYYTVFKIPKFYLRNFIIENPNYVNNPVYSKNLGIATNYENGIKDCPDFHIKQILSGLQSSFNVYEQYCVWNDGCCTIHPQLLYLQTIIFNEQEYKDYVEDNYTVLYNCDFRDTKINITGDFDKSFDLYLKEYS